MINESFLEKQVISWIENLGYSYLDSRAMLGKREDSSEVIIFDDLKKSFKKINNIDDENVVNKAFDRLRRLDEISVIDSNMTFTSYLQNGIKIRDEKNQQTKTYQIVDFKNLENNVFVVSNQFKMMSNNPAFARQVPDVVVYINGLPISIIELKSPHGNLEKNFKNAFNQIKNYQKYLPKLFIYNCFNVISDDSFSRVGSLSSNMSYFTKWKKSAKNTENAEEFFKLLFDKKHLLNLIENFIFFLVKNNQKIKVMPGYHQFFGVKKAINGFNKIVGKETQGGIFWHTQGTGKSLSMVMLLKNLIKAHPRLTTILITDRRDLDEQLFQTFVSAKSYLNQDPQKIETRNEITTKLKDKKQNGIFFSTVQKFNNEEVLSNREDILIITDEAHRSHRNIDKILNLNKNQSLIWAKGYGYFIRKAFPKATFIGFTGTPIESKDHNTIDVFGKYIDKYSIANATKDGFVVPIRYEQRQIKLHIKKSQIKSLNQTHETAEMDIKQKSRLPQESIKKFNSLIQKIEHIVSAPKRIQKIAQDFITHYKNRCHFLKGKAIFVAFNRNLACQYYQEIIKLDSSFKTKIKVIATNSSSDETWMNEIIKDDRYRKESAAEFKDPDSNFKIAIVVDMWLTGFDVPSLDVLYIDRPLKKHNLMQAIARVNRRFEDKTSAKKKEFGLIVDYIGIQKWLRIALKFYAINEELEVTSSFASIEKEVAKLEKIFKEIFEDILPQIIIQKEKINQDSMDLDYVWKLIQKIQNELISQNSNENKEKQFIKLVAHIKKIKHVVFGEINIYKRNLVEILILTAHCILKRRNQEINLVLKAETIKKEIAKAIEYSETEKLFTKSNQEIEIKEIIETLEKKIKEEENSDLVIEEMKNLVSDVVEKIRIISEVKAEKMHEKLQKLIQKYQEMFLTKEQLKELLHSVAKEGQEYEKETKKSNKHPLQRAFYDILLDYEKNPHHPDKDKINAVVDDLYGVVTTKIQNPRHYWNSTKLKHKIEVHLLIVLTRHNYPPDVCQKYKLQIVKQIELKLENTKPTWINSKN